MSGQAPRTRLKTRQRRKTNRQRGKYPMPPPETRTEHEAKSAAAAAKARAALTPRSNIWRPGVLRRAAPEGPAQRSGTSVMARPEEELAPYRPNLSLLTPYIVARWPLRSCGPLLPCAEYPGWSKLPRISSMHCCNRPGIAGVAPQCKGVREDGSFRVRMEVS